MRIWLFREGDTVTNAVRLIDTSIAHRAGWRLDIYSPHISTGRPGESDFLS